MATPSAHAPHDAPMLPRGATLAGHPTGLFNLFFSEMWERFSYYGMRALLVFYMLKGFLGYDDEHAYGVYGAYTALVYATPFVGGILADRYLGPRRAVVMGGTLMAAGHLLMTLEHKLAFFGALALLIVGNGFFKPNISTMVGGLYGRHPERKDAGFTLFYMGINLGAAMAPLLCGYVGETYGWHWGFGLATIGMLVGLAVFVVPTRLAQLLIAVGALGTAGSMVWLQRNESVMLLVNGFVALALVVAAGVSLAALSRSGLPKALGAPPAGARDKQLLGLPPILGIWIAVALTLVALVFLVQAHEVAGWVLAVLGGLALFVLLWQTLKSERVERQRMAVVFVLMFFSMLFWAFFEQAGSSINNFTDRNVDRVSESRSVTSADVGTTMSVPVGQELLGYPMTDGTVFTMDDLDRVKKEGKTELVWTIAPAHVGMGLGGAETPASVFQAVNPIFILLFGLAFSTLWAALAKRGRDPSAPMKFALALVQLALGFAALWYGTTTADERGMVGMSWLLLSYLLQTTGELCLSPVGLSMVTKLAPARMVATVMGAWFLATAFSNTLAAVIAKLTGVGGEGGEAGTIPPPLETLHTYGNVFLWIAVAAAGAAVLLFVLVPLLKKWMHEEPPPPDSTLASAR